MRTMNIWYWRLNSSVDFRHTSVISGIEFIACESGTSAGYQNFYLLGDRTTSPYTTIRGSSFDGVNKATGPRGAP